jgi:hypothetical protein
MYADRSITEPWIFFRQPDSALALHQVRASDHHLTHTCISCTLDNVLKVIVVRSLAVVHAAEYLVRQVDADLPSI